MKKLSLLLLLLLGYGMSFAQENCSNTHRIYRVPSGKTPKVITKLGTAPQFTTLRHLNSADEVYNRMKALGNNAKYRNEINSLMMSLGYTGVNDPKFDRSDVKRMDVPFGAIGMLGGAGNSYEHAMIAVPNKPTVKAWHITPAHDGCGLYVMSDCGNAFHYANPGGVMERERIVKEYVNPGPAKLKVNVYARYREKEDCEWCGNCDIPGSRATVKENKLLLAEEEITEIPVGGSDYPVKNVYIDVDKKTFKRIKHTPEDTWEMHDRENQLAGN
jgi:hypothetical protein